MAQYVGTVIGTKMDKTAKVLVTRMVLYRKLRKVGLDNNLKFESVPVRNLSEGKFAASYHNIYLYLPSDF